MTDTRPVKNLTTHNHFADHGWNWFLPRQALAINIILSTATAQNIDGGLDHLVDITLGSDNNLMFGGLDAPLAWSWEDDGDDEPSPEQQQIDARSKQMFEQAVTDGGHPMPATLRDLFDLLATIGLCTHTTDGGVERWRLNTEMPGPDELLPMPADENARYARMRWESDHEPVEQAILSHLCDNLDYPDEILTSLQRLADITGEPAERVRETLPQLLQHGEFRMVRGTGQDVTDVDPAKVAEHARFRLIPNWERFSENRIRIRHGGSDTTED
ncbi:DUF6042 family protein [Micromonospora carbonacea]|uniref:DUF6042 family protein n=1 Tax=Micromonospora carbonacea TaxID=47853 RepID=UPI0037126E11